MKNLMMILIPFLAAPAAFATQTTVCKGNASVNSTATVVLTTASDDTEEGQVSITLASRSPMAMPVHYTVDVVRTQNHDPDADVSMKYKGKPGSNPNIQLKVNENPAMGASYITNVLSFGKIKLSCEMPKES